MISNIFHEISQFGIIPVIKINEADNAIDLMAALIAGGLPCIEITFRTNAAFDSIKRISSKNFKTMPPLKKLESQIG